MNALRQFYENTGEREAVKAFLIEALKEIAIERTFSGVEVSGIKDARECVDKMFDKLEEAYGKVKKPIETNSR
jgi:hypothetical protein